MSILTTQKHEKRAKVLKSLINNYAGDLTKTLLILTLITLYAYLLL